jgi:small subunit ribosomal protein S2
MKERIDLAEVTLIYGARGGVHIIDLTKTLPALKEATKFVEQLTAGGGSIMFVGTKRQGAGIVATAAKTAGMPYVTERWLGGMLTNYRTIQSQVKRLIRLEEDVASGDVAAKYNKKEALGIDEEIAKLEKVFGGIKAMDQLPDALFVVDVPREIIAVHEAIKLGIPVVGIADSNTDPDLLDYPIPANDDAIKSISVITSAIAEAAKAGAAKHEANAKTAPQEVEVAG